MLSAGASGAVFGLAGVLLMLLRSPLLPIPQLELKKLRRSVWYFALLNFVIDGGSVAGAHGLQIDNMAHLGGFLSGMALGIAAGAADWRAAAEVPAAAGVRRWE